MKSTINFFVISDTEISYYDEAHKVIKSVDKNKLNSSFSIISKEQLLLSLKSDIPELKLLSRLHLKHSAKKRREVVK